MAALRGREGLKKKKIRKQKKKKNKQLQKKKQCSAPGKSLSGEMGKVL